MMVKRLGPEDADDRDGEQDEREGELDVRQPHEDVVDSSSEVAGDQPGRHAEHARDEHGGEADHESRPGSVENAGEQVTPQMVRYRGGGAARSRHVCRAP